jgi:predicted outer membrane protein
MSPLIAEKGLRQEDLPKLRERFDTIIRQANKNPRDFDDYYKKEEQNITMQVKELFRDEAIEKALEMVETSARFELVRKDVVRGMLDGTI